jgi:hypothetical protein
VRRGGVKERRGEVSMIMCSNISVNMCVLGLKFFLNHQNLKNRSITIVGTIATTNIEIIY